MKILSKIKKFISNKKMGYSLKQGQYWEIGAPKNFPKFIRSLLTLFSEEFILYLEGRGTASDIKKFLSERQVTSTIKIKQGTIFPKPEIFHLPITKENLDGLASLLENRLIPEVCTHVHVYRNKKIFLQWYDASFGDPILLSKEIPEEKAKKFCEFLGSSSFES